MYFIVLVSIMNNRYKQFKTDALNCLSVLKKNMHNGVFDGSSNIQKYFGVHAWNSTF